MIPEDQSWTEQEVMRRICPELCEMESCPRCFERGDLAGVIVHLNDDHGCPREQIADWLDERGTR